VQVYAQVDVTVDGERTLAPENGRSRPLVEVTLSSTGVKSDDVFTVAAEATQIVYDSTRDIANFSVLLIIPTQNCRVEFTGSAAANNSNLTILADFPFLLGSNDTLTYSAAGAFAGTAQDIETITVKNLSTTTAAKVRRVAFN